MKSIYFDTSAYVKLFKQETGTEEASLLFRLAYNGQIQILMSYWTITETSAVIDKWHRLKEISDENYPIIRATIWNNLKSYAQKGSNVGIVPVTNYILRYSIDLINKYQISADDALHLSTGLATDCDSFICADRKLLSKTGSRVLVMQICDVSDSTAMKLFLNDLNS